MKPQLDMMITAPDCIYKRLGLTLIGLVSCAYSIFLRYFAELHIQLPFLNFPIFVGEIILIVAGILLLLAWRRNFNFQVGRWYYIFSLYFLWMLIKAFLGYWTWGPLAFRNAALFYYPAFFVLGYNFYARRYFSQKIIFTVLVAIVLVVEGTVFYNYCRVTFFMLFIALAMKIDNRMLRGATLLLALFLFPIPRFFMGPRADLLAACASFLYLGISLALAFLKLRTRGRFWIVSVMIAGMMLVGWQFGQKKEITSMLAFKELLKSYHEQEEIILNAQKTFKFKDIKPRLYNPYPDGNVLNYTSRDQMEYIMFYGVRKIEQSFQSWRKPKKLDYTAAAEVRAAEQKLIDEKKSFDEKQLADTQGKSAYVQGEINNILFRVHIWKDMVVEMIKKRAILGINFGQPQRSMSIEILGPARPEFERDGWITPHNSFLHMIYRGGIVGAGLVISFLGALCFLTKRFIALRSATGLLLTSTLVYWTIFSLFGVVLEFPHNAIPFWSLLGMTFAYYYDLTHYRVINPMPQDEVSVSENTYSS